MASGRCKVVSRISNLIQGIWTCELSGLFYANDFLNQLKEYLTFYCISKMRYANTHHNVDRYMHGCKVIPCTKQKNLAADNE